ncbi:MAG: restriction endonuclease [Prolixibacteraceae bacterium]|nr:restriction endonuclease [Prolixibacteraceae bacterium]
MQQNIIVTKQTGETQFYSENKLLNSLLRSGAGRSLAEEVVKEIRPILYDGVTTKEIYKKAFALLKQKKRATAARYSLKKAIMDLGPSGFPFEKFVAEIFRRQEYENIKTGIILKGKCIQHEVDVVGNKGDTTVIVECKYHNSQSKISNVQTLLYVKSRFQDIEAIWRDAPENKDRHFRGSIFTNTRFSGDAEEYGVCAGLWLVSWSFPQEGNLRQLVEQYALFPVTTLTGLSSKMKQDLLGGGVILVDHLCCKPGALDSFDLSEKKKREILDEAETLSKIDSLI